MPWRIAALRRPLHASSPKFFQAATQADFLKGDVENLSIDSHGRLMLGPATELVYETAGAVPLVAACPAPTASLFVGTGNEGKVFRVDAQGKGSLFFDAAELEVHALAPAPDGGLYVGTSPDGKIYKVDRNGTATTFFDPDDKYIWALAVDAKGNLYAGTGEKGVDLQDHARRQGHALLQDEGDARDGAGVRQGGQPARRHRIAGPRPPGRPGGQGVRPARLAVPGNPRAAIRRQGHALRRGR